MWKTKETEERFSAPNLTCPARSEAACARFERYVAFAEMRDKRIGYADICVPHDSEYYDPAVPCEKLGWGPPWLWVHGFLGQYGWRVPAMHHILYIERFYSKGSSGSHAGALGPRRAAGPVWCLGGVFCTGSVVRRRLRPHPITGQQAGWRGCSPGAWSTRGSSFCRTGATSSSRWDLSPPRQAGQSASALAVIRVGFLVVCWVVPVPHSLLAAAHALSCLPFPLTP